jgi:pimeloyl-ACP methyl ester carboxylesterase
MNDDRTGQQIKLQDGRSLGYAEFGKPDGTPVFYFHGFPSSRLDWLLIDDGAVTTSLNVRLIAPDRPGYGLSDHKRGRKILDWPEDVIELADALHIDQFSVLGISGGGPYAAVCAFGAGHRLRNCGIVCGMGPAGAPGMQDGARWAIPGSNAIMRRVTLKLTSIGLQRDPGQFLTKSKEVFSEPDKQLLDQPELAGFFIAGMQEAFRQGIRGANHEAGLYTRPWGFKLEEIAAEVHLWHGGLDNNVPISVGRAIAQAIPNCQATFLEDEGHLTLPRNHLRNILSALAN